MRIYIISDDAEILEEKSFNEITNDEIVDMYDAGSDSVDCYESVEELAAYWNSDEIFYPSSSYMRVIND